MTETATKWYRVAALLILGAFIVVRWRAVFTGPSNASDVLVVAVVLAVGLRPIFPKISLGGVTLGEVELAVQREVNKAQEEAARLRAAIDLKMMPIWEAEHSSVQSDWSEKKVRLLESSIEELEAKWRAAAPTDKPAYVIVLRDLLWEWLAAARHHWSSTMPYQEVWRRVEKTFADLGGIAHTPSR